VTPRRILATSGGFVAGPVQQSARLGNMLLEALRLTGAERPRVCLVFSASGDDPTYYALAYEAFIAAGCDVNALKLFPNRRPTLRSDCSPRTSCGWAVVPSLISWLFGDSTVSIRRCARPGSKE